eukprot:TRINITY_DN124459_c0_g1_i1.p1 TRINITY_DN124459_c0_g1~~TRINITY_DN124459_c0_g1_i1.p1  ORF type:complete len:220 (+),score=47.87 TRINITY_DN124459_c0_g1_i1:40-660(+)
MSVSAPPSSLLPAALDRTLRPAPGAVGVFALSGNASLSLQGGSSDAAPAAASASKIAAVALQWRQAKGSLGRRPAAEMEGSKPILLTDAMKDQEISSSSSQGDRISPSQQPQQQQAPPTCEGFDFFSLPQGARTLLVLVVLGLLGTQSWRCLLFLLALEASAHFNGCWNGGVKIAPKQAAHGAFRSPHHSSLMVTSTTAPDTLFVS